MEEICIIKYKFNKIVVFILLFVSAALFGLFVWAAEKYIMPVAANLCMVEAKERANTIINSAAKDVLSKSGIELEDIIRMKSENGTTMLSADTTKVNMLCADISKYITESLTNMENNRVSVPYGTVSGIGIFANSGPSITFELTPVGGASVDYDTEFNSAGINQTNYKIWLTANVTVSLVNPLYNKKVNMTRKIMLADIIIKGDVPSSYLGLPQN